MDYSVTKTLRETFHGLLGSKSDAEIQELARRASMEVVELRRRGRAIIDETDRQKTRTARFREELDKAHLLLANFQYERRYYEKEIRDCEDFQHAHTDEQIGLVPLEEFWEAAPPELTADLDRNKPDEHLFMLRRLEFERMQRAELLEQLKSLKEIRDKKSAKVEERRKLTDVSAALAKVGDTVAEIQRQLGSYQWKDVASSKAAELLPAPMYVLYTQLCACRDAHGEDVEVAVEGDIPAAQAFAKSAAESAAKAGVKRPRLQGGDVSAVLQPHPLAVVLDICPASARVVFYYMPALHLVFAKAAQEHQQKFLGELFDGDDGADLPSEAAKHVQVDGGTAWDFPQGRRERPYGWCQKLAGLDFLPSMPFLPGEPQVYSRGAQEDALRAHRQGGLPLRVIDLLSFLIQASAKVNPQVNALKAGGDVTRKKVEEVLAVMAAAGGVCAEVAARREALLAALPSVREVTEDGSGAGAEPEAPSSSEPQPQEGAGRARAGAEDAEGEAGDAEGEGEARKAGQDGEEERDDGEDDAAASASAQRPLRVLAVSPALPHGTPPTLRVAVPQAFPLELPTVSLHSRGGLAEAAAQRLASAAPHAVGAALRALAAATSLPAEDLPPAATGAEGGVAQVLGRSPGKGPEPNWRLAEVAVVAAVLVAAWEMHRASEEMAGGDVDMTDADAT